MRRSAMGGLSRLRSAALAPLALAAGPAGAQPVPASTPAATYLAAPSVSIANGILAARVFLPDPEHGFYRGVRFDHAGMFGGLTLAGHDFYRPWFDGVSNDVNDVSVRDGRVIVSPNTAANGPVEEFNGEGGALGYAAAAPGETFVKIGVGVLRRIDAAPYRFAARFPLVDGGQWRTRAARDRVTFVQTVRDPRSGYAYRYAKTIRLGPGATMFIDHELRNTGGREIATQVYDHNFLNIDGHGTGPGLTLATPFALTTEAAVSPEIARVDGRGIAVIAAPPAGQHIMTSLKGFEPTPAGNRVTISDARSGASVTVSGDQPLDHAVLWAIAPVMAFEPFVAMRIAPGKAFRWSYRYDYAAPSS